MTTLFAGDGLLYLGVALLLLATGLWLWGRAEAARALAPLPAGRVVYADRGRQAGTELLVAPRLGLVGRPDYLLEDGDGTPIPVEVKTRPAPPQPYASHVMQVVAYCALVAETSGIRPNRGIIQYADRSFAVTFTPALEQQLHDLLHMMRRDRTQDNVPRSHEQPAQCARCPVRAVCDEALR